MDPEIFERRRPEAILYKILERWGPKSHRMTFECSFQSFSYRYFAKIPPKGGGGRVQGPLTPPLNAPLYSQSATKQRAVIHERTPPVINSQLTVQYRNVQIHVLARLFSPRKSNFREYF